MTTETATKRSLITFFDSGSRWQKAGRLREYIAVTAPLGPAGVAIACVHRDAATQRWFSQVQVDGRMWPPEVRLSVEQAHGWNGGAGFWWRNFAALPEATHAAERLIQDLFCCRCWVVCHQPLRRTARTQRCTAPASTTPPSTTPTAAARKSGSVKTSGLSLCSCANGSKTKPCQNQISITPPLYAI